ncbi:MAG: ubiquitin-like domain-containing protein [Clostridium sp.]|nr:ubiquitin-like domain-containing protein [Clostridium sp.]
MANHSHLKRKIVALVVTLAILLSTTAVIAAAADTFEVTLYADGKTVLVQTREKNPVDIFEQAGFGAQPGDFIDDSGFSPGTDGTLTLYRAATVRIIDDGKEGLAVIAGTVDRALTEGGYELREEDVVYPAEETPLTDGMEIKITRAFRVQVTADGQTQELWLTGGTVKQALAAAEVSYKADDEISPKPEAKLTKATDITVGRVTYKTRTVEEEVAFSSSTRYSNDLYVGETKVEKKGVNGVNKVTYKDKYVDGKKTGTTVEKTVVIKEPVEQLTLKGAISPAYKPVIMKTGLKPISVLQPSSKLQLDENGIPKNYKSVVVGLAKSYSPDVRGVGAYGSSGRPTIPGNIAVDPRQFPYGTELYIVSTDGKYIYGYAVASDTGGFVKTNSCMVDLLMPNLAACIEWGARNVRIYVL